MPCRRTLVGPFPCCALCLRVSSDGGARSLARPHARTDDRWRTKSKETGDGAPQWGAVYSTHYVFIRIADVFDPIPALPLSSSAAFIALFFFFFVCFWLQKISAALSGWGRGGCVSVDLHNPVASPVGPVVVRCQLEKKRKGEFLTSWHLGWWSGVGGVGGSRGGRRGSGWWGCLNTQNLCVKREVTSFSVNVAPI